MTANLDRIEEVVRAARILLPSIEYKNGDNVLAFFINNIAEPVRFIRISLDDENALHLRYIEVFTPGSDRPKDINGCDLRTSSCYPGTESQVLSKRFLRRHGSACGFHTKRELQPWAEVDFGQPLKIGSVIIHNRADGYWERARHLRVQVSPDGTRWETVYSRDGIIEDWTHAISNSLVGYIPGVNPTELARVVSQTVCHDYRDAVASLQKLGLPVKEKSRIIESLTNAVLRDRELEWTNHGIQRTFRYWTPDQKSSYLRFAGEVVENLRGAGYSACIGYGGVLSFIRDYDLIPHDDDLDIIVAVERSAFRCMSEALDTVSTALVNAGLQLSGDFLTHRHARRDGTKNLDCFVGFREGDYVSWFPGPRKVLRFDDVFPPMECDFLDARVVIPRNPFKYVAAVYGAEWRIPKARWNHSWDHREYGDWFGQKEAMSA